ncbi:MAG TPA: hypothetical protein VM867_04125 [Xanthobacteraceae bacterium]|jgi:hypothetical protein|nr:hypothetical protein [Xanthobacteraceae bacterium]
MFVKSLLVAGAILAAVPAQAQWYGYEFKGNDTGGIISWSPAAEATAGARAAAHCASYNKVAVITSVHRIYGDYIGFICAFPRGYDPVKWSSGYYYR